MWQPACRWHHDVVKQGLERMLDRGELMTADMWLDSAAAVRLTMANLPLEDEGGCQKSSDRSRGPAV